MPNLYDILEISAAPRIALPIVSLNLKLVNPISYPMDFQISVPINTRVFAIQQCIADLHGEGINNISVSFHHNKPDAPAPVASTLMELGILQ